MTNDVFNEFPTFYLTKIDQNVLKTMFSANLRLFRPKYTNIDQNVLKNDVFREFATFLTNKHQNRPKRIEKRRFHRISDFFDQKTPK